MKRITSTALALLVSITASPRAEQQAPKELQPSLQIFETVSRPMPDFDGVAYYTTVPDSTGALREIGHSGWVKGWFRQMEPMAAKFAKLDEQLRMDVNVYGDTVREEGEKVLDATANLKKALSDLDRTTSGKVQDLLATYNDEVKAARVARSEFDAASKRAEEASYLVDARSDSAKECNLLLERSKLEAEKSALLARIERDTAFLNGVDRAIKAVEGGPQAIVAYVTDNVREAAKTILIEAFHSGTRETLFEIGSKIAAIDKSLEDVKCKSQASELKAAKSNLEARMIQVLVAFGKILDHRANAWRAVDRLANLQDPQTGRKLAFFQNLQSYNAQVNLMGRTIFDSVTAYLEFLGREPMSRGPLLVAYIDEDIETVEGEKDKRDPSGKWSRAAGDARDYLDAYAKWYGGEISRGQTVLADLREGKHLDFVDRMLARATKELGGTVSYEDIMR